MNVSGINIFPIKSLGGISVDSAVVEDRGLQFDRRWMLIDEKRKFLSQREVARMALVGVQLTDDGLRVTSAGKELKIPFEAGTGETASVKIWSSSVRAEVYPDQINSWFSNVLGIECRLVLMPDTSKRKVSPFYAVRKFEDTVSFADGYPYLLIGESSLADLNRKIAGNREEKRETGTLLVQNFKMNRFRPNLVVEGSEAFAEDTWKKIRIGETVFHVVKPCARCVVTTIDQATAEKGKEPLATLSQYRKKNGNVLFGQNLIAETPGGTIRVGDEIEILETK